MRHPFTLSSKLLLATRFAGPMKGTKWTTNPKGEGEVAAAAVIPAIIPHSEARSAAGGPCGFWLVVSASTTTRSR